MDQPAAALVDLEARGLLEDTIIVWGGEFGRTPQGEPRDMLGRDPCRLFHLVMRR